jgi:hypothetical protein
LHKLLAYGYLKGSVPIDKVTIVGATKEGVFGSKLLIDDVIESVCKNTIASEESVEIQIMKVL